MIEHEIEPLDSLPARSQTNHQLPPHLYNSVFGALALAVEKTPEHLLGV
jgi:hypothetical protein